MPTTIQVSEQLKKRLAKRKKHARQPYAEVIEEALDFIEEDEKELSVSAKKALKESRRQLAAGKYVSLDEAARELGL